MTLLAVSKLGVQKIHNGQYSKIEQRKIEIKEIILGLEDFSPKQDLWNY